MSSPIPRIRLNKGRVHTSCGSSKVQDWNIEALLASQPHFKYHNGRWSGGGPLYVWKRKVTHTSKSVRMVRNDNEWSGTPAGCSAGGVQLEPPSSFSSLNIPSYSTVSNPLIPMASTGLARTRPGNPVAGLGQFLAELRDLPRAPIKGIWSIPIQQIPKVLYAKLKEFRNLGDEYLNVVFGWKPFVNDLREMYKLWKSIDRQMAQIIRNNGRTIRRRAVLESSETSSQVSQSFPWPYANVYCGPPNWATGTTQWTKSVSTKVRTWYVAAYQYYIPDVSSSQWNARARAALFGALPTPELLWNIMPWSWLIDWFSNVGDVVSNFSMNAVDNLITRYAFTMRHTIETIDVQSDSDHSGEHIDGPGPPFPDTIKDWNPNSFTYRSTQVTESKVRIGGINPFGFGTKLSSLSSYQLSILAALGISRGLVQ